MERFFIASGDRLAAPYVNFNRYNVDSFIVTDENLIVLRAYCKVSDSLQSHYEPNCKVGERLPDYYLEDECSEERYNHVRENWD